MRLGSQLSHTDKDAGRDGSILDDDTPSPRGRQSWVEKLIRHFLRRFVSQRGREAFKFTSFLR